LRRKKLPRGTGSIVDLLGPGCGASVASGLRRAAAARTDGTVAGDVLSELQGL
jgi:hypothetical protein